MGPAVAGGIPMSLTAQGSCEYGCEEEGKRIIVWEGVDVKRIERYRPTRSGKPSLTLEGELGV